MDGGAYRVVMSKSSKRRTSAGKGINGGTNVNRYSQREDAALTLPGICAISQTEEEAAKRKLNEYK